MLKQVLIASTILLSSCLPDNISVRQHLVETFSTSDVYGVPNKLCTYIVRDNHSNVWIVISCYPRDIKSKAIIFTSSVKE
jgi:hypothetical protein